MRHRKAYIKNYKGTNYEVGTQIGKWMLTRPDFLKTAILPPHSCPLTRFHEISGLLDRYCSGINQELKGFSDTVGIPPEQAAFYAMTYLERGCSLMAVTPGKTEEGHTLMARNYDFNDEMEEMCFAYTEIEGKYRYIASTLNLFGRCDGMNEHGLAACKASCGLPVGNFQGGRKAGITGFSFWIVIRSILENCKNVEEAAAWAMNAPIGYNINLMLADSSHRIAMLQCMDGHKAYRILEDSPSGNHFIATNHVTLPEIKPYETLRIKNSLIRYDRIKNMLDLKDKISKQDLKDLLSASYPDGLCCHYYPQFFGTLRSMIFDVNNKSIEMTFGSPQTNNWRIFPVGELEEEEILTALPYEKAGTDFYNLID